MMLLVKYKQWYLTTFYNLIKKMLKVKVSHKIWDTVQHKISLEEFIVVWYYYIDWNKIEYIVVGKDMKNMFFKEIEISTPTSNQVIGFTTE